MADSGKFKSLDKNANSKFRILDFSGYSDTLILRSSFLVSFLITSAIVVLEIAWKLAFAQNLVGVSHTFVFMGMQVRTLSLRKPFWTKLDKILHSV